MEQSKCWHWIGQSKCVVQFGARAWGDFWAYLWSRSSTFQVQPLTTCESRFFLIDSRHIPQILLKRSLIFLKSWLQPVLFQTQGWGELTSTLVPWMQGFRHPTRNECMGWFAQIQTQLVHMELVVRSPCSSRGALSNDHCGLDFCMWLVGG